MFSPVVQFRLKSYLLEEERQNENVTIAFCGVVQNGIAQFGPILDTLPGQVWSYHTETRKFHVDRLIEDFLEDTNKKWWFDGKNVNVVGASLGGVIAPFAIEKLRQLNPGADMSKWHVVMVDTPCGADTLVDKNAKFLTPSLVSGAVTSLLPAFVKAPIELPKWDEITVPPIEERHYGHREHTDDQYKQWVIEQSSRMLGIYPLALKLNQVHWMNKVARDGSFERACRNGLAGVRTTYFRCTMGSGTVKPTAAEKLQQWIPHMDIVDINATQCGFLQNQPEFDQAFRRELA